MERLLCLAMGYVFGLFQTGYILSRSHHIDIRSQGSGNSGATNVLRVMGKKAGILVFLGDSCKMILACLLTRVLFQSQADMLYLYLLYTASGVILGHNYPFYMGFRGGKGISATVGLLISIDWKIALVCVAVFWLVFFATRYVSLGSIVILTLFAIGVIVMAGRGAYGLNPAYRTEFDILAVLIAAMGVFRHRSNIKRLLNGTENKIGKKKE